MNNNIADKKHSLGCFIMIIIPLFLIGLTTLYIGLTNLYLQVETNNWVSVTAKIIDVEIVATRSSGGGIHGGDGISYETKCSYSYFYKNKKYTNNIISIGYGSNGTENHQDLYDLLKYANTIKAYINPDKPYDSILAKGFNSSTISLLIFSVVWNSFILLFFRTKNLKQTMFIFIVIFISGFIVLRSGVIFTDFKKKIKIIEKKSEQEIEKMGDKELEEMIEQSFSNE